MAIAIIKGVEHEVRTDIVGANNYGVSVLDLVCYPKSTVNLATRKPSIFRYKIHADDGPAATRQALAQMKASGEIDDFKLAPEEEAPPPVEKPAPKAPAAPAASSND